MGKKDLRNRTQFTSTLENELYKILQELSKDTSVPISKTLDRAVLEYIDTYYPDYLNRQK